MKYDVYDSQDLEYDVVSTSRAVKYCVQALADQSQPMRHLPSIILSLFAGTLLTVTLFGARGYFRLQQLRMEENALEAKNRQLQSDIDSVERQISELKESPLALEKQAREQLGYSKNGEVVYLLSE